MIDILLATFNGASYIRSQIFSIISQDYTDWRLIIHDDGSTDRTVDLIKELASYDQRIRLIEDNVTHLGPGANFMHLLNFSDAPYCCFCDQDDVWFDNKLTIMHRAFSTLDHSRPQVLFSGAYLWDSSSNCLPRKNFQKKVFQFEDILFHNGGMQGAASMFNAKMRDTIHKKYEYVAMHDQILSLAGILYKGIHFIDTPLFLYRQHANNVTAHIPQNKSDKIKVSLANRSIPVVVKKYYDGIIAFYHLFRDEMTESQRRIFELYICYPNYNSIKRFFSILTHGFSCHDSRIQLIIKLLIRPYFQ